MSDALGPPLMPLRSGVYVMPVVQEQAAQEAATREGASERLPLASHVVVQAQPASQSYGMFLHNLRFYEFDGDLSVLEVYRTFPDDAVYFLARVAPDGRSFEFFGGDCGMLPENFRAAQDIDPRGCEIAEARILLRSLALISEGNTQDPLLLVLETEIDDLP